MSENQADFTLSFRGLSDDSGNHFLKQFKQSNEAKHWLDQWRARLATDAQVDASTAERKNELMQNANPAYIPRNHRVEEMIQAAYLKNYEPLHELMSVLSQPYSEQAGFERYAEAPTEEQLVKATFCGT